MLSFLLWLVLLFLCWPIALLALVLYPLDWLQLLRAIVLLPARVLGYSPGR